MQCRGDRQVGLMNVIGSSLPSSPRPPALWGTYELLCADSKHTRCGTHLQLVLHPNHAVNRYGPEGKSAA